MDGLKMIRGRFQKASSSETESKSILWNNGGKISRFMALEKDFSRKIKIRQGKESLKHDV